MTKEIFEKSIFKGYRTLNLNEARKEVTPQYKRDGSAKTTVFISHKHDDLEEISGLIGLLEKSMISKLILTVEIHQCLILHQE